MREIIIEGSTQLNLNLSTTQLEQIEAYLLLLQKWNRVFNLTAIHEVHEMLSHHVFDSLAVQPFFSSVGRCLDVGTGAGFPGMILAIACPEKHFTLLDSSSKKTGFLMNVVQGLGLKNVTVVNQRLELWQPDDLFDAVISRAFSSVDLFIKEGARFVAESGVLLAMKGPKIMQELSGLDLARLGWAQQVEKLYVPFLDEARYLLILRRGF